MILIQEVLISEDLLEEHFLCKLESCKGACCWEGDFGAPLEPEEMDVLEKILPVLLPTLPRANREAIERKGPYRYYKSNAKYGTSLQEDKACVFMVRDQQGVASCGIEKAYLEGKIPFRKPVSCHLYPVRVTKNVAQGFEALNYERWDICSAACGFGVQNSMPLYRFVSEALKRKYGEAFYEELEAIAHQWKQEGRGRER